MQELKPYIQHIGNCGAKGSPDPADSRCICGLRQIWLRQKVPVKVNGM